MQGLLAFLAASPAAQFLAKPDHVRFFDEPESLVDLFPCKPLGSQ